MQKMLFIVLLSSLFSFVACSERKKDEKIIQQEPVENADLIEIHKLAERLLKKEKIGTIEVLDTLGLPARLTDEWEDNEKGFVYNYRLSNGKQQQAWLLFNDEGLVEVLFGYNEVSE